jgi:hypothetical protein
MPGDENDLGAWGRGLDALEQVEAGHVRQHHVDDGRVHGGVGEALQASTRVVGAHHVEAAHREHVAERLAHARVIVDNQDPGRGGHAGAGAIRRRGRRGPR